MPKRVIERLAEKVTEELPEAPLDGLTGPAPEKAPAPAAEQVVKSATKQVAQEDPTAQESLKRYVAALPHLPGVYRMIDVAGSLLYVG